MGRIAGLVSLKIEDEKCLLDPLLRVGSELAMHVVAAKPLFLAKDSVSSDALENEREVLKSQVVKHLLAGLIMFPILLFVRSVFFLII